MLVFYKEVPYSMGNQKAIEICICLRGIENLVSNMKDVVVKYATVAGNAPTMDKIFVPLKGRPALLKRTYGTGRL